MKSVRCVFLESGARSLSSWQRLCTCACVFFTAEASLAEPLPRDVPLLAEYQSAHMCPTPGAKMAGFADEFWERIQKSPVEISSHAGSLGEAHPKDFQSSAGTEG